MQHLTSLTTVSRLS